MREVPLLDYFQWKLRCEYISDLHWLGAARRAQLAREVERLGAADASLHEWNDALEYLLGQAPRDTPETARDALIAGLKSWEDGGWYPALVTGTRAPLFGELTPEADGIHRFGYHGLPDTFRIAVSGPGGAQATDEPFTRTVFYTHLTYDWQTNTITSATSPVGFYGLQFLSTLVPTLIIEGILLWLFGFRAKRDWLVFLIVNLVTQAGLHLWIAADLVSIGDSALQYMVLLVAEVPILAVELAAYVFLLQEHSRLRRAAYAACANIASYALGYFPLHWAVEYLAR